jgi:predicted enzyme related to lactoylglutathione lyase
MSERTSYATGVPCWVDLISTDPAAARSFYGSLFGWDYDVGSEETGRYAMALLRGKVVAGVVGQAVPAGMPTAWTTYLAADDADATVQRAIANGATVMMGPMDVLDLGRVSVATDPTGAVFGIWQGRAHVGATLVNEPGTVTWNELNTRDIDTAIGFYGEVFGVTTDPLDNGPDGPRYRTFNVGEDVVGGMQQMGPLFPPQVPPHWMTYFAVDDADATAAAAARAGGKVMMPPTDSPYGRSAVLLDPQGGAFTVMRLAEVEP